MAFFKRLACCALLPAALSACDFSVTLTNTFSSSAALDGEVNSSGAVNTASDEMNVGDLADNSSNRGFVSFDVSSLSPPSGKTLVVESATLRVYMVDWFGSPYALGNTLVDLVDYGASLGASDYGAAVIDDCGALSSSTGLVVERTLDVTQAVSDYLASGAVNRYRPQFRLRQSTATDNDGDVDETEWYAGNFYNADYRPRLAVRYRFD